MREWFHTLSPVGLDAPGASRSRARLRTFLPVVLVAAAAGLAFTFARPPEYRATASLRVGAATPSAVPGADPGAGQQAWSPPPDAATLAAEAQVLTSAPLLDEVVRTLGQDGVGGVLGPTVDQVRAMVRASPVEGTDLLELAAEGRDRALLRRVLEAWVQAYLAERAQQREAVSVTAQDDLGRQAEDLERQVQAKRRALEAFRAAHGITSHEREDNEAAARLKRLTQAIAEASQKEVEARSRLSAVRADLAAGKPLLRPEDKQLITNLEARLAQLRGRWNEANSRYTPRYLEADPLYKALGADLEALEKQVARARAESNRAALAEAEQNYAAARENAEGLKQSLEAHKRAAADFTARFAEHQALQEELKQLEALHAATRDRLVRVGLAQGRRAPEVQLLAPPSVPSDPVRPLYLRDAALALGGSLVLALLAVWLTEFLHGAPSEGAPAFPSLQIAVATGPTLPGLTAPAALRVEPSQPSLAHDPATPGLIPAPAWPALAQDAGPRELAPAEAAALWQAAGEDGRVVIGGLLGGLSLEELTALRWEDVDLAAGSVTVPGEMPRSLPLAAPLRETLARRPGVAAGGPVLARGADPITPGDLEAVVAFTVRDAGLVRGDQVTAASIRHTYVAYLVRQGARLADVERIVGRLPAGSYGHYARLAPPGTVLPLEHLRTAYPLTGGV